ncbi:MAG: hypothetical protein KDE19_10530 [Caldilineaceae bacterium]|nr:hypothetical protein [Caldilineaceae bacterium]
MVQWIVNSEQWTVDSGQWTVGSGQWAVGSEQWTVSGNQFLLCPVGEFGGKAATECAPPPCRIRRQGH